MFVSAENIQDQEVLPNLCLVGHFLTERSIKFQFMKGTMAGIWRSVKGITIREIGLKKYICFSFSMPEI